MEVGGLEGKLQLVIRTIARQNFSIVVSADATVDSLMQQLRKALDIQSPSLVLTCLGLQGEPHVNLDKDSDLLNYDVQGRKVLVVPGLPPRPQMPPPPEECKLAGSGLPCRPTQPPVAPSVDMPELEMKRSELPEEVPLAAAPTATFSPPMRERTLSGGTEPGMSPQPSAGMSLQTTGTSMSALSSCVSLAAVATHLASGGLASSAASSCGSGSLQAPVHLPHHQQERRGASLPLLHGAPQSQPLSPRLEPPSRSLQPQPQQGSLHAAGQLSPARPPASVPSLPLQQHAAQQQRSQVSSPRLPVKQPPQQPAAPASPKPVSTMPLPQTQVAAPKAHGSCPLLPLMPTPPSQQTSAAPKREVSGCPKASGRSTLSPPPLARQVGPSASSAVAALHRVPNVGSSMSWSPPLHPGETSPPTSLRVLPAAASSVHLAVQQQRPQHHGHRSASSSACPALREGAAASSSAASSGPPVQQRIRQKDLHRLGKLGVGAFGVVTLEADRRTGNTYALKAVSKGYLADLNMEYSVVNEKKILRAVDSPFVVHLIATYNGREHVFFLMEAALGGELFTTYERLRLYGSEPHAKFYVACVTEALNHLHDRNVIYRDLKPENLLLDSRGYCKLTDMGLAKVVHQGLTRSVVGTPDYMAPEVILQKGHGKAVDWWMLGVLLYELLIGRAPFEAKTQMETYDLIQKGIERATFPPDCPRLGKDLVCMLCKQEPNARLRTPVLRENSFFNKFDWPALQALRMEPPYKPKVAGPTDLSNFRSLEGEDPPVVPYHDNGSGFFVGFEDDALGSQRSLSLNPPPVGNKESRSGTPMVYGLSHSAHARENLVVLSPRSAAAEGAPSQQLRFLQQSGQAQHSRHHYPNEHRPQLPVHAKWQQAAAAGLAMAGFKGSASQKAPHSPTATLRRGGWGGC